MESRFFGHALESISASTSLSNWSCSLPLTSTGAFLPSRLAFEARIEKARLVRVLASGPVVAP